MISQLQFTSGYPLGLAGIGGQPIRFSPRINVLFGPNGAGKTTILSALASAAGCGGGGWSVGTQTDGTQTTGNQAGSISRLETPEGLPFRAVVEMDDQPVFYQDCYRDSEHSFVGEDYLETHAHLRSTGEKRIGLVNELIDYIEERFLTFKTRPDERPTLLLDEVDNHIGFAGQSVLWGDIFRRLAKKYQLIISTHSIFPLLLERKGPRSSDNILELSESYAQVCINELAGAIDRYNDPLNNRRQSF